MPSKINYIIPPQNFEAIRDRIAQILLDELANQYLLTADEDLNLNNKIYIERLVGFNFSELPALNVGIERGDYANYHQGYTQGTYRFYIECNTTGETQDDNTRGDERAKKLSHKLMGKVREILDNPVYDALGFPTGKVVSHRHVDGFLFTEPTRWDSQNATEARIFLIVKAGEYSQVDEKSVVQEWGTHVLISDGPKGYYWEKQIA